MDIFYLFKRKELSQIKILENSLLEEQIKTHNLVNELNEKNNIISSLEKRIESLSIYESILITENDIKSFENELEKKRQVLLEEENVINKRLDDLQIMVDRRKKLIIELDDKILIQDFNVYNPIYEFDTLEEYKEEALAIKEEQKEMIKCGQAAGCMVEWTVNGSLSRGAAHTRDNIKQILRCFNNECDILISRVKFNNIEAFKEKINRSFKTLNRINKRNGTYISEKYLKSKIDELELAYEYTIKKQEEKEEKRRIRERLREEAKLRKEIEEARKNIDKETKHYQNVLLQINQRINKCKLEDKEYLLEKKHEIELHLQELGEKIKDIDYREANKKAGYVYIISNIGSFGENVYKIGMTRRLDPMERVDELGDASVPFKFDIHAMIFSDNAPKLEAALHRAFAKNKINMVNNRREFFKVSLDEIEQVVKENYDKTVDFKRIPEAQQYRESLKILENIDAHPECFQYKEYIEDEEDDYYDDNGEDDYYDENNEDNIIGEDYEE